LCFALRKKNKSFCENPFVNQSNFINIEKGKYNCFHLEIKRLPHILEASVTLPSSKSISNRLLILRELSRQKIIISNLSQAEDTRILAHALSLPSGDFVHTIDVGNAGTALRFLTAYLSYRPGIYLLTGSKRLQQRPVGPLVEALRRLGARIAYVNREGYPPLYLEGGYLKGGKVSMDAGQSSQYVSALMLIAPVLEGGLELTVENLISEPYVNMTLELLRRVGVDATRPEPQRIIIPQSEFKRVRVEVEPDWSAAAFWYGLLASSGGGDIILRRLPDQSIQGDRCTEKLFRILGISTYFDSQGARIVKQAAPQTDFVGLSLGNCPDVALPYIVSLVILGIGFEITGLEHLHIKESDRIAVLTRELAKTGIRLEETAPGVLRATGVYNGLPVDFNPENDHRVAMSLVQFANLTDIKMEQPECVSKSYPDFWENFKQLYR